MMQKHIDNLINDNLSKSRLIEQMQKEIEYLKVQSENTDEIDSFVNNISPTSIDHPINKISMAIQNVDIIASSGENQQ